VTATKTPEITSIPVAEIQPIEGLNPRGKITDETTAELTASIKQLGVLMPVLVAPRDNGHWPLIAGARRLHSARKLKLKEIPALIRPDLAGAELEAAIVENAQREDLDPVEEATAIARLIEEKGLKQVDAAKAMGKSERWLRERLRLLKLPPATQRIFAARQIPIEAVVQLEKVAKVAPALADLVAVKAKHGVVEASSLTRAPGVGAAVGAVLEDLKDQPVVKVAEHTYPAREECYTPARLPVSPEAMKELAELYDEIPKVPHPYGGGNYPRDPIVFTKKDIAAARDAGALLELEDDSHYSGRRRYITDPELIADLARTKIAALKRSAQRQKRENEKKLAEVEERRAGKTTEQERGEADEKRKAEQARLAEERAKVNAELGERLGAMAAPKLTMEVVRLLCSMAIGPEEYLDEVLADAGYAAVRTEHGFDPEDPDDGEEAWDDPHAMAHEVLEAIAAAETPEEAAAVVLRVAIATHFGDTGNAGQNWGLQGLGPSMHVELALDRQVEHIANQLGVLPGPMKERAKEAAKRRAAIQKEAAERAARVEAAKAEKAGEDESK
jgi:ParB/RepB/Spo0J family partition protein